MTLSASRARLRHPDRVPVHCERAATCTNKRITDLTQKKFLVPRDLTVAQFQAVLRTKIELQPTEAIFLFINGVIPAATMTFAEVDAKYKDSVTDMVHMKFAGENVFGKI